MNKPVNKPLIMLVSSMFIFGTIGIFRKQIPLSSGMVAFTRGAIGAIFLALFTKTRGRKLFHHIGIKKILWLLVSGAIMGINWILLFEAYNYTTVSVATLCYYMEPTFVTVASAILLKEKLTAKKSICTFVALAGMVLVSGVADSGIGVSGDLKGILLGLSAAVFYSVVVLMNKKTVGVDAFERCMIQLSASVIIMIPYLLLTENFSAIILSRKAVFLLIVVGIVHTGISYALYFGSMERLKTQTIAIFSYIDPIVALVFSAVLLSERMSIFRIIGAVLILGSAVLSELGINPISKSRT